MSYKDNFSNHREILDKLRARICLIPPQATEPMHETAVAQEFNVSRTPVRQVLQTLAREQLIEIRPSVGATVTKLNPETKKESYYIYRDLMEIAARLAEGKPLPDGTMLDLASIEGILNSDPVVSNSLFVSLAIRVQTTLSTLIHDDIIDDAASAAFFRMTRWRVPEYQISPDLHWATFRKNIRATTEAARSGDPAHVLRTVVGLSEKLVKLTIDQEDMANQDTKQRRTGVA